MRNPIDSLRISRTGLIRVFNEVRRRYEMDFVRVDVKQDKMEKIIVFFDKESTVNR